MDIQLNLTILVIGLNYGTAQLSLENFRSDYPWLKNLIEMTSELQFETSSKSKMCQKSDAPYCKPPDYNTHPLTSAISAADPITTTTSKNPMLPTVTMAERLTTTPSSTITGSQSTKPITEPRNSPSTPTMRQRTDSQTSTMAHQRSSYMEKRTDSINELPTPPTPTNLPYPRDVTTTQHPTNMQQRSTTSKHHTTATKPQYATAAQHSATREHSTKLEQHSNVTSQDATTGQHYTARKQYFAVSEPDTTATISQDASTSVRHATTSEQHSNMSKQHTTASTPQSVGMKQQIPTSGQQNIATPQSNEQHTTTLDNHITATTNSESVRRPNTNSTSEQQINQTIPQTVFTGQQSVTRTQHYTTTGQFITPSTQATITTQESIPINQHPTTSQPITETPPLSCFTVCLPQGASLSTISPFVTIKHPVPSEQPITAKAPNAYVTQPSAASTQNTSEQKIMSTTLDEGTTTMGQHSALSKRPTTETTARNEFMMRRQFSTRTQYSTTAGQSITAATETIPTTQQSAFRNPHSTTAKQNAAETTHHNSIQTPTFTYQQPEAAVTTIPTITTSNPLQLYSAESSAVIDDTTLRGERWSPEERCEEILCVKPQCANLQLQPITNYRVPLPWLPMNDSNCQISMFSTHANAGESIHGNCSRPILSLHMQTSYTLSMIVRYRHDVSVTIQNFLQVRLTYEHDDGTMVPANVFWTLRMFRNHSGRYSQTDNHADPTLFDITSYSGANITSTWELDLTLQFRPSSTGWEIYQYINGELVTRLRVNQTNIEHSSNFEVIMGVHNLTFTDMRLYNTTLLESELYSLSTGREVIFKLLPECRCTRDEPTDMSGQCERLIWPLKSDNYGVVELSKANIYDDFMWMSDYSNEILFHIDLPATFQVFFISLSTYNLPKQLEVLISKGLLQHENAAVYVADSCELYDTESYTDKWSLATAPALLCYPWSLLDPLIDGNVSKGMMKVTIPLLNMFSRQYENDIRRLGSRITLKMKGHLNSSINLDQYYTLKSVQVYARPFCSGYNTTVHSGVVRRLKAKYDIDPPVLNTIGSYYECECPAGDDSVHCTTCSRDGNQWEITPDICVDCECSSMTVSGRCDMKTGQCQCENGMNIKLAGRQCNWYIEEIGPLYGLMSGGTKIYITGWFGTGNNLTLLDENQSVWKINQINETTMMAQSNSFEELNNTVNDVSIRLQLDGEAGLNTVHQFQYRPNPILLNISHRSMQCSGGTRLKVIGQHFDSVAEPKLGVYVSSGDGNTSLSNFTMPCIVRNSSLMDCFTPSLTDFCNEDEFDDGISSKPQTSSRLRAGEERLVSNITVCIDFYFDDYSYYRNLLHHPDPRIRQLANLALFYDAEVFGFNPPVQRYKNGLIEIRGDGMTAGITISDYKIEVGSGFCEIQVLDFNRLTCEPPVVEPEVDSNQSIEPHPHVKVIIGNKANFIGYLDYLTSAWEITAVRGTVYGFLIVIILVLIIGVGLFFVRKRRSVQRYKNGTNHLIDQLNSMEADISAETVLDHSEETSSPLLDLPEELTETIDRCKISSNKLKLGSIIGKGHFGRVYKGELEDSQGDVHIVAVKSIKEMNEITKDDVEEFLKEAMIMINFNHENVLSLVGVTWEKESSRPLVVIPFMENGDLKNFLENKNTVLKVRDLLQFCNQISCGMQYLTNKKFVHRDLAARNCMVSADRIVKIADFGLSRDIYMEEYYRIANPDRDLPIRWMSIESIKYGFYNSQTDVWAFGVTCWEVLTRGKTPYRDVENFKLRVHVERGERLEQPACCPDVLYTMLLRCWAKKPEDRPTFPWLTKLLEHLLQNSSRDNDKPITQTSTDDDYADNKVCLSGNYSDDGTLVYTKNVPSQNGSESNAAIELQENPRSSRMTFSIETLKPVRASQLAAVRWPKDSKRVKAYVNHGCEEEKGSNRITFSF